MNWILVESHLGIVVHSLLPTEPRTHESPDTPDIDEEDEKGWKPSDEEEIQMEDKEEEEEEEVESNWNGPGQCRHSLLRPVCLLLPGE